MSTQDERLRQLFGDDPLQIPPAMVRLSFDATICTPIIASMIASILRDKGAIVTCDDSRVDPTVLCDTLNGLQVHIGQLTWVRQEEAQHWGTKP